MFVSRLSSARQQIFEHWTPHLSHFPIHLPSNSVVSHLTSTASNQYYTYWRHWIIFKATSIHTSFVMDHATKMSIRHHTNKYRYRVSRPNTSKTTCTMSKTVLMSRCLKYGTTWTAVVVRDKDKKRMHCRQLNPYGNVFYSYIYANWIIVLSYRMNFNTNHKPHFQLHILRVWRTKIFSVDMLPYYLWSHIQVRNSAQTI